ncbi:molybdenum cofactor guanylyltransferase [Aliikangiella marina]|uniref:Molybdenum cofactor guanylyltransferase n=1 Tax=Aliikangiella marina TaxID=1712262 RepID=A0A545T389_9GAMM|nr:molybdenum cofactor guanylyltransferase MobA [Aliikangiella marina]TQV71672.1 molybdenum cofactor guanylyltransferase [Aliikangiella marina]TQV71687.1 molybdenum cofactor guanylyltransferase [Aliikangiella marina]
MRNWLQVAITKTSITGLILSGGEGRRVSGKDKGLLHFKERLLIELQIEWLQGQVDDIIISANRNLDDYQRLGFAVVSDDSAGHLGPLHGVKQGLEKATSPWVFVHPVDLPNLPKDFIERIVQPLNDEFSVYYFATKERSHFLTMLINKRCSQRLNSYLANGGARVKDFLQEVRAKKIVTDLSEDCFANLNNLSDYNT